MIIVTQTGDCIVNFDTVMEIHIEGENSVCYNAVDNSRVNGLLGVYKDEKRSREVLDEIVQSYASYIAYKSVSGDVHPKVYRMPEE